MFLFSFFISLCFRIFREEDEEGANFGRERYFNRLFGPFFDSLGSRDTVNTPSRKRGGLPPTMTRQSRLSLHLDYGADAQECDPSDLEICERGMHFRSRWSFEIGSKIAVGIIQTDPRLRPRRMKLEGHVVCCEAQPGHGYETTLLFSPLPDELQPSLREFSQALAAR